MKNLYFFLFLVISVFCTQITIAGAATIIADSCSEADVREAVNDTSDGDTVIIPPGSARWSSSITLPSSHSISLKGSGIDSTIITDGTGNTFGAGSALVVYVEKRVCHEISGITFIQGSEATATEGSIFINKSGNPYGTNFRIHDCKFSNLIGRGIKIYNGVSGLIDNCVFLAPYNASVQSVSIFGTGSTSWSQPLSLGTANAVYIEDCTFNYTYLNDGALDAYNGARYVFRYNDVKNTLVGHHGADSGSLRSCFSWEIYGNVFTAPDESANCVAWAGSRGGTGVVFNNTATGYFGHDDMRLHNYRSNDSYPTWGMCNGANSYDKNYRELKFSSGGTHTISKDDAITGTSSGATATVKQIWITSGSWENGNAAGYLYLESQSGTFQYENLEIGSYSNVATVTTDSTASDGYACLDQNGRSTNQSHEPIYEWDNSVNGKSSSASDLMSSTATSIIKGRDFFIDTERPNYSPLPYPHPLITGALMKPNGFRVVNPG